MEPLLLRALRGEETPRPPVWLMRQAGRYLKEYQELKNRHSFLELCRTPELALEVTLQPLRIFEPDAAILFSDILVPADLLGLKLDFTPAPIIENPLRSPADVSALRRTDLTRVDYVFKTLSLLRKELSSKTKRAAKALIGFAGAPWTLACYFIDQGKFKSFYGTQVWAAENPKSLHNLLSLLSDLLIEYVTAQIESGAQVIQLFDTWAGTLEEEHYRTFALPYTQRLISAIQSKNCPTILYINGSQHLLSAMKDSGVDCLGLDWRSNLQEVRNSLGPEIALQGNLNPTSLYGNTEDVIKRTKNMLSSMAGESRYIANLGHGVLPTTPRENVMAFIEAVKGGIS